jgi:hypothetical protein
MVKAPILPKSKPKLPDPAKK